VQSLVLGGALIVLGTLTGLLGVLAELIGANRKLLEAALGHIRRLEQDLATLRDRTPPGVDWNDEGVTDKEAA
jgi:hypothetical protein